MGLLNWFKKCKEPDKTSEKYANVYELALQNCYEFNANNDFDEFTKSTIDSIEKDIARVSKLGVREVEYYLSHFSVHTDMEEVRKYFKELGFKVCLEGFNSHVGIKPRKCVSGSIRW